MYYLRLFKDNKEIKKSTSRFLGTDSIIRARKNAYDELIKNKLLSKIYTSSTQVYEIRICDEQNEVLARVRYVELVKIGNAVVCITDDGYTQTAHRIKPDGTVIALGSKGFSSLTYVSHVDYRYQIYHGCDGNFKEFGGPRIYTDLKTLRKDIRAYLIQKGYMWNGEYGYVVGVFQNGVSVEIAVMTCELFGNDRAVMWDEQNGSKHHRIAVRPDGSI